jgi:hypothetical protein
VIFMPMKAAKGGCRSASGFMLFPQEKGAAETAPWH